jgi:thiosulfate/3-mercaptopyruvate sulfurtransferase
MSEDLPSPLVTIEWLAANLQEADVRVIDASWRMPGNPPAIDGYRKRRIPGATYFDLDEIADHSSGLPHMLPSPQRFAEAVGGMGVSDADRVVVYDDTGVFSAARVWWTFRAMGHERVAVLDGGLPKWLREGRPVEGGYATENEARYRTPKTRRLARTSGDVRAALSAKSAVVLDARPAARFSGDAAEPRPGLRRGHMPGAVSLPHSLLLADDGTMKPPEELRALFAARGVKKETAVIATCGSGVTAAVIALALEVIGATDIGLYDGSWTEWGRETNDAGLFPVAAGVDDKQR